MTGMKPTEMPVGFCSGGDSRGRLEVENRPKSPHPLSFDIARFLTASKRSAPGRSLLHLEHFHDSIVTIKMCWGRCERKAPANFASVINRPIVEVVVFVTKC
jgi:hypothetical protein